MISNAVFLGSKKFGFNLFKALYSADPAISWTILCPPDLNDTRTFFDEFQDFAKLNNIILLTANSAKMVEQYVLHNKPDVMIVCGYYRILSPELLENVKLGVWGIHNSLLPKYRGGSPLRYENNAKSLCPLRYHNQYLHMLFHVKNMFSNLAPLDECDHVAA